MYQNRSAFIDELNSFISCSKNSFNNILKTINWTKQSLLSTKEVGYFHNYEESTLVADQNMSPTQEETPTEGQVYILDMHYGNPLGTISFLQHTSGGGDQLYNDMVASLLVNDQPTKTNKKDVKTEDKAAALVQLLKMERDAKRRRISYKNKVHTKNKSHTEVLREVLEEQMLTITGGNGSDSAVAANDRLQPSLNQAQELIAIRPPQGNPHLAWLDVLEKADRDRNRSDHPARAHRSEYSSHSKHSDDQKEGFKYGDKEKRSSRHSIDQRDEYRYEDKERKKRRKDKKRKEEDNGKHRDREKKTNEWVDEDKNISRNNEDKHHKKKKKKRSRSNSPRSDFSDYHRHKSKHKKKKH